MMTTMTMDSCRSNMWTLRSQTDCCTAAVGAVVADDDDAAHRRSAGRAGKCPRAAESRRPTAFGVVRRQTSVVATCCRWTQSDLDSWTAHCSRNPSRARDSVAVAGETAVAEGPAVAVAGWRMRTIDTDWMCSNTV